MRIAICFSGQVRTWDKCIDSWEALIDRLKVQLNADVDVFCHAWDFNTDSNGVILPPTSETFAQAHGILLPEGELDLLFSKLQPKAFLVENERTSLSKLKEILYLGFRHNEIHGNPGVNTEASQFYSVMRAAHIKKKYEIDNNFRYDMCIRTRYDLFFNERQIDIFTDKELDCQLPVYNTLYSCHTAADKVQYPYFRLGDIFWFADSVTFDMICDFYRWTPVIGMKSFNSNPIGTEHSLYFYAKMLNMSIMPLFVDPKIYRLSDHIEKSKEIGLPGVLGIHELI